MMKKTMKNAAKMTAVMALTAAIALPLPVMADVEISGTKTTGDAQSEVVLEKTEAVTPVYTVSVPAKISLGKDSATLDYELDLNENGDVIPNGKEVAIQIQSAGPATSLATSGDTFKVEGTEDSSWADAEYQIYDSDAMANPHYYAIGEDLVVWGGGNHGIQQRKAKVLDYDSIEPDTYSGVINYNIIYRDAQ